MTNYEKYKSEIVPIARMGRKVAMERDKNKIRVCLGLKCVNCLFYDYSSERTCDEVAMAWADAEYIESEVDWSKVAVDTIILVSDDIENWYCRHFAKYENGLVYAWDAGKTSYTTDATIYWEYAKLAEVE
mgnify:CR=1 FL=1